MVISSGRRHRHHYRCGISTPERSAAYVRLAIAAPDTWGLPDTVELRKHDQLEVGHPSAGHATITVVSIRKVSKGGTVQLAVAISRGCNANRLEVWKAIHGI